jgi:hypothetical protein
MADVMTRLDFRALWSEALSYERFVDEAEKNATLWRGVYQTTPIPDWAFEFACQRGKSVRLLVIAEDWCGDASNTVPVLAKLGDAADCLEMRVVRRDEHPAVMDRYLTDGARAIPIVIALDSEFRELGHWGPRPAELQQWVMENKLSMPSRERYPRVRRWYAKDKGEATLREVLGLLG